MEEKFFNIKSNTSVFIKRTKENKWKKYNTSKNLSFTKKDFYFIYFPIEGFFVFRDQNWVIAVHADDVEEEKIFIGDL